MVMIEPKKSGDQGDEAKLFHVNVDQPWSHESWTRLTSRTSHTLHKHTVFNLADKNATNTDTQKKSFVKLASSV